MRNIAKLLLGLSIVSRATFAGSGLITTLAGNGTPGNGGLNGPAISAGLTSPQCVALDAAGNVFIADTGNNRIVRVDAATGILTLAAGNGSISYSGDGGPATQAGIGLVNCLAVDSSGNIYIPDTVNYRVRRVDAVTGLISTIAGNGSSASSGDGGPAVSAGILYPEGVAVDPQGNLFVAEGGGNRIRRIDGTTGIITTYAGNGTYGFAGDGGSALAASFAGPGAVSLDSAGNLFIVDTGNYRVRRIDAVTGVITTAAGSGMPDSVFNGDNIPATNADMYPGATVVDGNGNLFLSSYSRIRRVDAATGVITTIAGLGNYGSPAEGVLATSAHLGGAGGLVFTATGNLIFADYGSNRVRQINLPSPGIYTATQAAADNPTITEGHPVTVTATVTPLGTTRAPSGTVDFYDEYGLGFLGSAAMNSGTASLTTSILPPGNHSIVTVYEGSAAFLASSSGYAWITVKHAASVTFGGGSPNPSQPGQSVIFATSIQPVSGVVPPTPTGTVQLLQGATVLATATLSNGSALIPASFASTGSFSLTVSYSGDINYGPAVSGPMTQAVKRVTSTAISVQPNPAVAGQSVTIAATVTPAGAGGSIQFLDGSTVLGTVAVSGGSASLSTTTLAPGSTHTLTANYLGDGADEPSSTSAALRVLYATTTVLTLNNPQQPVNSPVTFTAQVSPASATGYVQFFDGSALLGTVSVSGGAATLTVTWLGVGTHPIHALFSSNSYYATSSSSTQNQAITKAAASVLFSSTPNPSVYRQSVTATATLSPPSATGTIQFLDNGVPVATMNLVNGVASYTTGTMTAGSHTLAANYGGDANDLSATSQITQTVNKAATAITLVSSNNPAARNAAITFTATVSAANATGQVRFLDGAKVLGTVSVASGGLASFGTSSLAVGTHSITAAYLGDSNYNGSVSAILSQSITKK